MGLWILAAAVASAQTVQQSEASIAYLLKTVCVVPSGGGYAYAGGVRTSCRADVDCAGAATCEHERLVVAPATLYPPLAHPAAPSAGGRGEGILRYVPLCDDGSGDHEWAVSGGALGTPPTCAPADYIRCGDGTRPQYRLDKSTTNSRDYLIHAGGGGHTSVPGAYEPVWSWVNTPEIGSYTADSSPVTLGDFEGIYDAGNGNPLREFNRVEISKCTADGWVGNIEVAGLRDFTTEQQVAFQYSPRCEDADGNGIANCDDYWVDPASCDCLERTVAPPSSPNNAYNVYYHGRRIVRAVVADLASGAVGYTNYPLRDDGTGHAQVRNGDEALARPTASSVVAFTCHSAGCAGLEGTNIDDLHEWIDAAAGADVDVRAVFNSWGNPTVEVEACVSEYDGVDVRNPRGIADNPGVIDDTCSIYDQLVDTVAITGEAVGYDNFDVGGFMTGGFVAYYDPSVPGYGPPVDRSCLDFHCPGTADWSQDPRCAPCNNALHTLFNHLNTPFVYNEALQDAVQVELTSAYCDYAGPDLLPCDHNGDLTGVDLASTHWRQLVRKQFADAFRYGETDRCEGGPGNEWPYDHMVLLLPDRTSHDSMLSASTANLSLDLAGPTPPHTMADATYKFLTMTSPSNPIKVLCMQEATPGENAADFTAGGVPGCQ